MVVFQQSWNAGSAQASHSWWTEQQWWQCGQVKRKRSALNAAANAHGHSSRSHLSTMENKGRISLDPEVWKYDSSWNSTRMKPLGARLDDCEAAVGKAAKRRQEAEDTIKIAGMVRRNAADEENKLKAELLERPAWRGDAANVRGLCSSGTQVVQVQLCVASWSVLSLS